MIPIELRLDETQCRLMESRATRVFLKRCPETMLFDKIEQTRSATELESIGVEYGLCDYCSLSDLNLETASLFLSAIAKVSYKFPRIRSKLCYIGSKSGYVKALRELCRLNRDTIKRFQIQHICSDKAIIDLASRGLNIVDSTEYGKKDDNVLAQAFSLCGILDAVVLDESDFSGLGYKRLCTQLMENARDGFHPKGCEKPDYVIYHEFGHMLDYLCGLNEDGDFQRYYQSFSKKQIACDVSQYAATNAQEFFAEAFAEYMCSVTPREEALYLGKFLESKYKKTN